MLQWLNESISDRFWILYHRFYLVHLWILISFNVKVLYFNLLFVGVVNWTERFNSLEAKCATGACGHWRIWWTWTGV